jgi:hypothetical protein
VSFCSGLWGLLQMRLATRKSLRYDIPLVRSAPARARVTHTHLDTSMRTGYGLSKIGQLAAKTPCQTA